jgi:hypothetical protein
MHACAMVCGCVGQGQQTPLVVTVSDQSSNVWLFNYQPPSLTKVTPPNGPTQGGVRLTLEGTTIFTSRALVPFPVFTVRL